MGKKIFQITNATKFPAERELSITWLHTIVTVILETGHNVDLFNRKIVFEDHFTEQYFKTDLEHSLLGNSCTDIKPRTRSSHGQFHTVTVKRAQLSPNFFYFAILFD